MFAYHREPSLKTPRSAWSRQDLHFLEPTYGQYCAGPGSSGNHGFRLNPPRQWSFFFLAPAVSCLVIGTVVSVSLLRPLRRLRVKSGHSKASLGFPLRIWIGVSMAQARPERPHLSPDPAYSILGNKTASFSLLILLLIVLFVVIGIGTVIKWTFY